VRRYRNFEGGFKFIYMNVLSLFDGMSCGMIALERAGIKVDNYYASEIDKYAIKVSEANYPKIVRLGDVTKVKVDKGRHIDLLIAGSPCQGFSFAGKQLNFEDPRSKLFFEFVRLLKECRMYNPDVKFLLENVKMKKEYQDVISGYLGVQPIEINSALVSAQNRKRLYWTNIDIKGNYPQDKEIFIKDVLEDIPFDKKSESLNTNPSGRGMNGKIHYGKKSPYLTTNKGEGVKLMDPSTTNNVTTLNPKKPDGSQTYQQNRIYGIEGKMVCISAELSGRFNISDYPKSYNYRKATPIECERLQTVPDNYTASVSNSQRYKMLGNGWTVDVIAHIFKYLK